MCKGQVINNVQNFREGNDISLSLFHYCRTTSIIDICTWFTNINYMQYFGLFEPPEMAWTYDFGWLTV